jgi:dihydroxyacetone kinase-like protein
MGMKSDEVVSVLISIAARIHAEKDYITELDAVLGDGDHWVNMNKGYQALVEKAQEMRGMHLAEVFQTIGMTLMASIGGSSGVLYGSAFLQGRKLLEDADELDLESGCRLMEAGLEAVMARGKAKPGDKTMIDPLHAAVQAYRQMLDKDADTVDCMNAVVNAAREGMEATKDMAAQKGRATYQPTKGIGHIDAGAVTMFYTIDGFASFVIDKRSRS